MTKTQRTYGPYAPISPEGMRGLRRYLGQAQRHLADPTAPEPDHSLLCVLHGPFTALEVGSYGEEGKIGILVSSQNIERGPRWLPLEGALLLQVILAFGGGMSFNHNGKGMAYTRLFGGDDRLMLGRLFSAARPGETIRQVNADGARTNHHIQAPNYFTGIAGAVIRMEGLKAHTPFRGRDYAVETSRAYFRCNQPRSGIEMTEEEYRALLEDAFALFDGVHHPKDKEVDRV